MRTQAQRFAELEALVRSRPFASVGFVSDPIIEIEMERDMTAQFPSRYVIFGLKLEGRSLRYEITPMLKPESGDCREDVWRSQAEHREFCRRVRVWKDWLRPRIAKLGLRLTRRCDSLE